MNMVRTSGFPLFALFLMLLVPLLSGCRLLSAPMENEADILHDLRGYGQSGTITALNAVYPDKAKRLEQAERFKKVVNENVLPWLTDDSKQITSQVFEALMKAFENDISPDYRAVAKDAFDYLFRRVEMPTAGKILKPHNAVRLRTFFEGAVNGADLVIVSARE